MDKAEHKIKYGLRLEAPKPQDYIFGQFTSVPFEDLQPNADWTDYLIVKEFQNLNGVEPYACVAFTILNCVEILIKRKYGIERNYSDRFLAYVSGTKDLQGNEPHAVCEFLRKIGVVPQELWPFDGSIDTFDKFYAPIPPKLYELAQEFKKEWDFKHEFVASDHDSISKALRCSPLLVSVTAWNVGPDGLYYRPPGIYDNHATTMFSERVEEYRRVFDSYDAPHIKDVRWQDVPMMIKRFYIAKRDVHKPTFWERAFDIIKSIWKKISLVG